VKRIGSDLWIGAVTEFLSAHCRISQTGFPQTFRPGSDGEIVKERLKYLGLSLAIFGGLTVFYWMHIYRYVMPGYLPTESPLRP
jgi:hypothetical protein